MTTFLRPDDATNVDCADSRRERELARLGCFLHLRDLVERRRRRILRRYKIQDVSIDGVSAAMSRRSQMDAMMSRAGGQVATLLAMMRQEG